MTERELMIVQQLGSYSKRNLYKFLLKYIPDTTSAMRMATILDLWHQDCLRNVDEKSKEGKDE